MTDRPEHEEKNRKVADAARGGSPAYDELARRAGIIATAEAPMDADGRVLPSIDDGKREKRYKLVEIFESVKGEGTQAGIPMVFVRFSKCNLACTWCDTPYNRVAIELTGSALVANLIERKPAWVIFTGGEPTLQLTTDLTGPLKEANICMAIETNGMIWTEALADLNYINISPKLGVTVHAGYGAAPDDVTMAETKGHSIYVNEVRYTICDGQEDIWNVFTGKPVGGPSNRITGIRDLIGINAEYITISPAMMDLTPQPGFKSGEGFRSMHGVVDQKSLNRCLYLVNKYKHYNARLSVQVHKFIGAR